MTIQALRNLRTVLMLGALGLPLTMRIADAQEAILGAEHCPKSLRPVSVWDYAPQPEVAAQTIRIIWDAESECLVFHPRSDLAEYTLTTRDLVLEGGTAVVVDQFTFVSFPDVAPGAPAPRQKPSTPVAGAGGSAGEEGLPGSSGRSAGRVLLQFGPLLGDGKLRVLARGERGGIGGRGADGGDGGQGNKGAGRDCNSSRTSCKVDATGGSGGNGADGRNGGVGGNGGNGGVIFIANELRIGTTRSLELDTSGAAGGAGGEGGEGGNGGDGGPGGDGKNCGVKRCSRGAQGQRGSGGHRGNPGPEGTLGSPGSVMPARASGT